MKNLSILLLSFSLILLIQSCGESQSLDVNKFDALLSSTQEKIVLDVRTPGEYDRGHLQRSVMIDYKQSDFRDRVSQLDKTKSVFVYCAAGVRSAGAVKVLKELGFQKVYELNGGFDAWKDADKPIEK